MEATVGLLAFKGAGSYLPPSCTLAPSHTFHGLGGSCTSLSLAQGLREGESLPEQEAAEAIPNEGIQKRHNLGQHSQGVGFSPGWHVNSLLALWLEHFKVN